MVHVPVAREVMTAGKHVICEKPLTMNYGQAKEIAQAAKDAVRLKTASTLSIVVIRLSGMPDT